MLDSVYTVVLQKRRNYRHFGVFIGRDFPSGLYVVTVEPNSPATEAGIQPGDRVVAINGQLVSSIVDNPTDIVLRLAHHTDRLTLSLTRSNTMKYAGLSQQNGIDYGFDNYLRTIYPENVHRHEYIRPATNHVQHSRPRRSRRSMKTIETQTSFTNIPQEVNDNVVRQRSIPSMGTSHMFLRSVQSSTKDASMSDSPIESPMRITPPKQRTTPPVELSNLPVFPREAPRLLIDTVTVSSAASDDNDDDDGLREVRLTRTPNFVGFGFHIQYNRSFYLIHHVEPNSPAELAGLHSQDVIRRINNQATDRLPHKTFLEIISSNIQIILLVQPYKKFIRDNPQALNPTEMPTQPAPNKKNYPVSRNPLFRALSKLKSR